MGFREEGGAGHVWSRRRREPEAMSSSRCQMFCRLVIGKWRAQCPRQREVRGVAKGDLLA